MLDFNQLSSFTGSNEWHRHQLMRHITYTDGVKYVADEAGAYWFIDIIATMQMEKRFNEQEFQVWVLSAADNKGKIAVNDGNGNIFYEQEVSFTDFPEPGITFWFTDNVILLPSEY